MIPKVFEIDDSEWWLAPTAEQAIEAYTKLTGNVPEDFDPHELTEAELRKATYEKEDGDRCSFWDVYQERLAQGSVNEFFASGNY